MKRTLHIFLAFLVIFPVILQLPQKKAVENYAMLKEAVMAAQGLIKSADDTADMGDIFKKAVTSLETLAGLKSHITSNHRKEAVSFQALDMPFLSGNAGLIFTLDAFVFKDDFTPPFMAYYREVIPPPPKA